MRTDFLPALAPMLPHLILGVIVLVLCILVALVVLLSKAKKVPTNPLALQESGESDAEPAKKSAPLEFVRGTLAWEIRSSFTRAMKFLRANVSGRDYRYQVPWILLGL